MQHYNRPHPHVNTGPLPPGARQPVNPSPIEAYAPYAFEVDPPVGYMANPWDSDDSALNTAHPSHYGNDPSHYGNGVELDLPPRSRSRTRSVFEQPTEYLAFPEPQIYRSSSQRVTPSSQRLSPSPHRPLHRNSKSDVGPSPVEMRDSPLSPPTRGASPASIYYPNDEVCRL
jgi:RHO1 GDP-GTP exchange protein 1/2